MKNYSDGKAHQPRVFKNLMDKVKILSLKQI